MARLITLAEKIWCLTTQCAKFEASRAGVFALDSFGVFKSLNMRDGVHVPAMKTAFNFVSLGSRQPAASQAVRRVGMECHRASRTNPSRIAAIGGSASSSSHGPRYNGADAILICLGTHAWAMAEYVPWLSSDVCRAEFFPNKMP